MKSYHVNTILIIGYLVVAFAYWDGTHRGYVVAGLCGLGAALLGTAGLLEWRREQKEKEHRECF